MDEKIRSRLEFAKVLAREAGGMALGFFRSISELVVEPKGVQDMVSNADLDVETFIRTRLAETYPEDGIVGEEHGTVESRSGFTWVIDPIDGTANFVTGTPAWCVIIACVHEDRTKIAAIHDPSHDELFWAGLGCGAFLNDAPVRVAKTTGVNAGNTGVGMNSRTSTKLVGRFVVELVRRGGLFYRNASGGLMLCYVASGRLIGYVEPHMNAWDCLAGQLLVSEAGGRTEQQSADAMLAKGGRVIASATAVFDELVEMADQAFGE